MNAKVLELYLAQKKSTKKIDVHGNDGELFLAYVTPPTYISASEIVEIPEQSFSISVNPAPQNLPALNNSISYSDTNINAFTFPSGEELTAIEFSLRTLEPLLPIPPLRNI